MIRRIWDSSDAFQKLRPTWQTLYDRCPEAPVFLSWEWASTWWTHFHGAHRLHLITFTDGADLLAVAPLVAEPGGLRTRLIGSEETTDYADVLALPSVVSDVVDALFAYWGEQGNDVLLEPLQEQSPLLRKFEAGAAGGLRGLAQRLEACPTVHLPSTWEQYLVELGRTDRHELRRKLRRAESAGALTHEVVDEPGNVEAALNSFYRLHQSSGDPRKAQFLQPRLWAFFSDVSLQLAARGWLRLSTLRLDDRPVAAVLGFDRGSTVALYNSGYDPQFRPISPGIVLLAYELRSAIERGRTAYDFLRGNEPYKYDLGAHDRFVWRLCLGPGEASCPSPESASDGR